MENISRIFLPNRSLHWIHCHPIPFRSFVFLAAHDPAKFTYSTFQFQREVASISLRNFLSYKFSDCPGRFSKLFSTRNTRFEAFEKTDRENKRERQTQRESPGVNAAQPTSPEGRLEARVQESLAGLPFYPFSRRKGAHLHIPRTPTPFANPPYLFFLSLTFHHPTVEISRTNI